MAACLLFLLTNLAALWPPPARAAGERDDNATRAILALLDGWLEASKAGDCERLIGFYHKDAIFMDPHSAADVARDERRAQACTAFDRLSFEATRSAEEILLLEEWAVVRSTYRGTVTPMAEGSAPIPVVERHLQVLQLQPDRGWKIVRDIWNHPPPE